MRPPPLTIQGMKGLGDNLFQRPFVRAAARRHPEVYLETPWPELYEDIKNVFPVRSNTTLRTQAKNERASAAAWAQAPRVSVRARFGYGSESLKRSSILESLEACVRLAPEEPLRLDLPKGFTRPFPQHFDPAPYVVVRPATVRKEWSNPWRNPLPEYLFEAARSARRAGFRVVLVADLQPGEEEPVGPLPPYDVAMLHGDLSVRELFGLVEGAAGVIGGVGWIVPASIALRKPALIVLGGNGAHNAPEKITDPRLDVSGLTWARPDAFCMCEGRSARGNHECDKTISDLSTPLNHFLAALSPLECRSPAT